MEVVCSYLWTWNLSTYHFSQLGIQLISMTIHFHESCHSFKSFKRMQCLSSYCVFVWLVMPPSLLSYRPMFKGKLEKFYLCSQNSLCVSTFESVLWLLCSEFRVKTMFQVSCRRCGTHHGPPSTRVFPSTSAHRLGTSLRNKNLVPWDLYALMEDSLALDIGSHQ